MPKTKGRLQPCKLPPYVKALLHVDLDNPPQWFIYASEVSKKKQKKKVQERIQNPLLRETDGDFV